MQRQILVPLEGSELAETILPYAQVLAQVTGGSLTLLRVTTFPLTMDPILAAAPGVALTVADMAAQEAAAQSYLATVAGRVEQATGSVQTAVVTGDPATTIVAWAAQDPPLADGSVPIFL